MKNFKRILKSIDYGKLVATIFVIGLSILFSILFYTDYFVLGIRYDGFAQFAGPGIVLIFMIWAISYIILTTVDAVREYRWLRENEHKML